MRTFNSEIDDIVTTVWSTLLELPIEAGGAELGPDESTVTGIVHIDGAWHGAVVLQCPLALGEQMASAMFRSDAGPTAEDVGDALGELTNVVAGNIKALLPEPCAISLPTIARGSHYAVNVVGTEPVVTARFTCNDLPVVVAFVQRASDIRRDG